MNKVKTIKRPNVRMVSRVAGVSPSTVSLVLNNSPVPSEETRLRVLEAVKATGYSPDPLYSAAFSRRRSGAHGQAAMTSTIGFLTSRYIQEAVSHIDGYYHDALAAILDTTRKNNYYLMFDNAELGESAIPGIVKGNRVDGLLIQVELAASLKQMLPTRLPVVFIDRVYPDIHADSVVADYAQATYEMLDYLWNMGHRNIALFTDTEDRYYNYQDIEGYRRFFQAKGVALPCPELLEPQHIRPETNDAVLAAYVEKFMSLPSRPTAIVFSGNVYALGMLPLFQRAGLSIPRDLSIASLNDMKPSNAVHTNVTSHQVPMAQIGVAATELLLQRIADPSRPINKLAIHGRMVERTSCGPVPVRS